MKNRKRLGLLLIVLALLLTAASLMMPRDTDNLDTVRGILAGVAIGLGIVGLITIVSTRSKRA